MTEQQDHLTIELLRLYMQGGLTPQEREQVEDELSACGHCMDRFIALVSEDESKEAGQESAAGVAFISSEPDMRAIEDKVIAALQAESEARGAAASIAAPAGTVARPLDGPPRHERRLSWLQRPAAQYAIAASITLLLLGSGAFAGISEKLGQLERLSESDLPYEAGYEQTPSASEQESWSERMMGRAGSWLDGLQSARFDK